jgi:DNA-binding PucR family transcriptional regulator
VNFAFQGQASAEQSALQIRERAREVVAEVSLRAVVAIGSLGEEIGRRLLVESPAFGQDAELEGELHAAIEANLKHVFERVIPTGAGDALVAPPDALHFAASVLHRGIDTGELIQAYRVGQNMAWSWWMVRLAGHIEDRELLIEALEISSARMFTYVDAVLDEQGRLWEEERRRWLGRAVALRAEVARRVLRGELLTVDEVAQALEYQIDRPLIAGILWDESSPVGAEAAMDRLEGVADAMALSVGVERALLVPAGSASLWAWFAGERPLSIDAFAQAAAEHLRDGQGAALGLPSAGLEGFRSSHRQARRARRLAELARAPAGLIRFDEVETLCLMNEDVELVGDFIRRKLGGLAADDPVTERVRETVLVWLQEGGNARRAALRLGAHKNTVHYRVQRAEEVLGHPLSEDRLGLELALTVAERVGLRLLEE